MNNQAEPSITEKPNTRPLRDEWGVYDPEQAGLAAVVRRVLEARAQSVTTDSGAGAK